MAKIDDGQTFFWFKMYSDFFDDHRIKSIECIEPEDGIDLHGREVGWIYLNLLSESTKHGGELRYSKNRPYTKREVANLVHCSEKEIDFVFKSLRELELISIKQDGTLIFIQHPELVGSCKKGTERKRKYRNGKSGKVSQCDTDVTPARHTCDTKVTTDAVQKVSENDATRDSRVKSYRDTDIKSIKEPSTEVEGKKITSSEDIGKDDPNLGQSSFAKPETERVRQPITREELHTKIETMNQSLADKVTPSEESEFWDWLVMNEFKVNRSGKKVTLTASTAVGVTLTTWRRFRKLEKEKSDSERREKHGEAIGQRMSVEDCQKSLESFTEFSWPKN